MTKSHHKSGFGRTSALTLGAMGVVFGDIGTSPLYAFREAVVVDDRVRGSIAALAELAPLHNPAALAGIDPGEIGRAHV